MLLLSHSWQGLRQSCWFHREIAGCACFWLACCIGKIRWHGGVVEDWGAKGFLRPIVRHIFFSFEGNCLAASKYNLWHFLWGCVWAHVHVYPPNRRHKKEGEEVNGKVVLHTYICVYVRGSFSYPVREKSVSYLSLCFKGGDESNLQMASAVEEHLNPISTRQTQMDHRRVSVVKEA